MKKLLILMSSLFFLPMSLQATPLDAEQQQQVRELVRTTLVENPDILVETMNELRKREIATQQQAQQSMIKANHDALFNNPADPSTGPTQDKAGLTMVYFMDYNCGFCKKQSPVLTKMAEQFPNLRIVYKDLPILGDSSRQAASMALAAHKANPANYLKVKSRLMSRSGQHDSQSIASALKAEGFDPEKLKNSIDNKINQQLEDNIRLASELDIQGTPAMVFPDQLVGGYTEEAALVDMIKERLQ